MDPSSVVAGATAGTAVLAVGWRAWRRDEPRRASSGHVLGWLAPQAAFVVALYANADALEWPPRSFLDAVPYAAAATLPALLLRRAPWRTVWVAAVLAVLFWRQTGPLHERSWQGVVLPWVAGLTAASSALHGLLALAAERRRDGEVVAALALVGLAAAPALGLTGTGLSALLVAAVAGSAVGAAFLGLLRRERPLAPAVVLSGAVLLAGLLANGVVYAETPRWPALALALAPAALLVPGRGPRAVLLRLVLVGAIAGAGAWAAVHLGAPPPSPYG